MSSQIRKTEAKLAIRSVSHVSDTKIISDKSCDVYTRFETTSESL